MIEKYNALLTLFNECAEQYKATKLKALKKIKNKLAKMLKRAYKQI